MVGAVMLQNIPCWKILKKVLKFALFAGVFLFVIFTVLANLGGNNKVYKEAIEDYLNKNTHYEAHIGTLNMMRFFPDILIDVEGVTLVERGTQQVVIRADKAKMALGFFDILLGQRRFKTLAFEHVLAEPGVLMTPSFRLEKLDVTDKTPQPVFVAEGFLGVVPFQGKIGLAGSGGQGHRAYGLPDLMPVVVTLGDVALKTDVIQNPQADLRLDGLEITKGGKPVLQGTLDLDRRMGGGQFGLKGRVELQPHTSVLMPDMVLTFQPDWKVKGTLGASRFDVADFSTDAPLVQVFLAVLSPFGQMGPLLPRVQADLDLSLEHVIANGRDWGSVQGPLSLAKGVLKVSPLAGQVLHGALSGDVVLEAGLDKPLPSLAAKLAVKHFDLAALAPRMTGTADVAIDVKGEGKTLSELLSAQAGSVVVVSDKAKISAGVLEGWAVGLLPALFPRIAPDGMFSAGCGVADLHLNAGKFQTDSVFLDLEAATVHVDGSYDAVRDLADLSLQAVGKGAASAASIKPVYLAGGLGALKVSGKQFALSGGGFVKGARDPVFQARALSGMDLPPTHPCKAFVIESEVLAPPK